MTCSDDPSRQTCPPVADLARSMIDHGVRRIHVLAWRDLADPDSGGSEIHADHFMRRWQEAGLEVLHRTSFVRGQASMDTRHGYQVIRRGSRLGVFPRTIASEVTHRMGPYDALVEIWNGMPWLSPLWCRRPHLVVLHHVHDKMWDQILPGPAAWMGRTIETSWAPRIYRHTETVTLCEDSRRDLLRLGWPASRVHVAPAGVDPFYSPGGVKTAHPSIVAVGRLAPVKRTIQLLEQLEPVHREIPTMRFTIVGDGPLRPILESWIEERRAHDWVRMCGRVDDAALRNLYRESWLITSASLAEGWGLTLTEAAGCGTPAVATDIGGHRSAVRDGLTGSLVPLEKLGERCVQLLKDHRLRADMGDRAVEWAQSLSWENLAARVLKPLHDEIVLGP